jgi:cyanophycin synthetase
MSQVPIIAITGTKGKTTTAFVVAEVLQKLGGNVLRVDTTGHYVNGAQHSNLEDSKRIWGLVPTVSPGRYLWEFQTHPDFSENGVAVLETALGSSAGAGLGYREHQVGVFLNVFEDHLGSSSRLKTKADIAKAKEFIFARIANGGTAVFNADDALVVDRLQVLPEKFKINLLPCGLQFDQYDLPSHLQAGGKALTVRDRRVVLLEGDQEHELLDLVRIPWTFEGEFGPSLWNVLMAAAAVLAHVNLTWSDQVRLAFESVRLDPYGGRLTLLQAANGTKLLLDYAHEKVSLAEVAKFAHSMTKTGKVYGVVRIAHDRTDELMLETGRVIGEAFDSCIVYDKIDGYWRKPKVVRSQRFPQVMGYASQKLTEGIKQANPQVERIVREDQAIARAAELAGPDDVVVVIVNDDIHRSVDFVKESFKAEFV